MRRLPLLLTMLLAATAGARAQALLPRYEKVEFRNGMTVLLMEQHEVPIASFEVIVKAGSVADPPGKEGLQRMTDVLQARLASMLAGVPDRDPPGPFGRAISEAFNDRPWLESEERR